MFTLVEEEYIYRGEFLKDQATIQGNKLNYTILSQPQETIESKDNKKGEATLDPNQIHYEIGGAPITLEVDLGLIILVLSGLLRTRYRGSCLTEQGRNRGID